MSLHTRKGVALRAGVARKLPTSPSKKADKDTLFEILASDDYDDGVFQDPLGKLSMRGKRKYGHSNEDEREARALKPRDHNRKRGFVESFKSSRYEVPKRFGIPGEGKTTMKKQMVTGQAPGRENEDPSMHFAAEKPMAKLLETPNDTALAAQKHKATGDWMSKVAPKKTLQPVKKPTTTAPMIKPACELKSSSAKHDNPRVQEQLRVADENQAFEVIGTVVLSSKTDVTTELKSMMMLKAALKKDLKFVSDQGESVYMTTLAEYVKTLRSIHKFLPHESASGAVTSIAKKETKPQ